jgi:hypothetical protein
MRAPLAVFTPTTAIRRFMELLPEFQRDPNPLRLLYFPSVRHAQSGFVID